MRNSKKYIKILFTGGGTGGHTMPIIGIVREIKRLYQQDGLKFYYMGPKDKLTLDLLSKEHVKIFIIASCKIRRYFSFQNFVDILFGIPLGFVQSFFFLLFIRPKLVFSKGGSGATVVSAAAKILRRPIFLHESDVVPGLSNKTASKWAKKIFISFPTTEFFDPAKVTLVGNPIRRELLNGDANTAKEIFHLTGGKPLLLFLGGSQGSQALNDFVLLFLNDLLVQ